MTRLLAITAAALTFAAPLAAETPLSVQVREHVAASQSSNEAKVYISEDNGHSPKAVAIFNELQAEKDGNESHAVNPGAADGTLSTSGVVNETAARIFAREQANQDHGI